MDGPHGNRGTKNVPWASISGIPPKAQKNYGKGSTTGPLFLQIVDLKCNQNTDYNLHNFGNGMHHFCKIILSKIIYGH